MVPEVVVRSEVVVDEDAEAVVDGEVRSKQAPNTRAS